MTLISYGTIPAYRQAELIKQAAETPGAVKPEGVPPPEVIKWVFDHVQRTAGL